jgi:hypothetical protein
VGQKLAQYRAALDSGADPAAVGQWITQTQARKLAADARLRAADGTRSAPARMSKDQIAATISAITGLMQALRYAATEDKAEIYAGLNVQLTYNPGGGTVNVRAEIGQTCTKGSCPILIFMLTVPSTLPEFQCRVRPLVTACWSVRTPMARERSPD